MAVNWTKDQQQVIDLRRRNILVSAAAGSGKTAVLVERILTMITEGETPIDIDRLLVVTFTRAAAGEMKERILAAVEKRLEIEPDNEHLQRQTTFIHNAQINTIDGFCAYVIKNYFHLIDLDPGYRTADEGELKLLKSEVVREVLEDGYQGKREEFHRFVEWYATGKSDEGIEELILKLYGFAMSHPWPQEWLEECRGAYQANLADGKLAKAPDLDASSTGWMEKLWEDVSVNMKEALHIAEQNLLLAGEADGPYMYQEAMESDQQLAQSLVAAKSYSGFGDILRTRKLARLSPKKDSNVSDSKKERIKSQRDEFKEILKSLEEQYFYSEEELIKENMQRCSPVIGVLVDLTLDFMERFTARKRKKNLLDFTDMEHLALNILVKREGGQYTLTQAAKELSSRFEEVLIDEYQDSNYVQEMLLSSVSRQHLGLRNIFMVGDVKQSIYRFRLACPDLFMEKYRNYTKEESDYQRIDLHKNFRSRSEVLDTVNHIFYQIMHESLGNITYDHEAALYPGAQFPESSTPEFAQTEMLLVEKDSDIWKDAADGMTVQEIEARVVANRISEIVGVEQVLDKATNSYRKARYSDCVILLRTITGWADTFVRMLDGQGIPAYVTSKTGYFSALEVVTVLNYLHICDNPMQEIPFTAILRSPIGGCRSEELALIKSAFPKHKIYEGSEKYRMEGENQELVAKLSRFYNVFAKVRAKTVYLPIHELILELLEQTGYGRFVEAMPSGEQRVANIQMLVEKAIEFEKTSYRGLFNFIRYIENLRKYDVDFGEVNLAGEQEDTVRIMSIHKSKGLEFPIVFVSGMGKKFNLTDINARIVLHPDYGIGTDCIDPVRRLKSPTLLKQVIRRQTLSENLGEEMRVLYVALTRAKEKLIMTGMIDRLERRTLGCRNLLERTETHLPYTMLLKARDYWGWVLPALARSHSLVPLYQQYGMEYSSDNLAGAEVSAFIRVVEPEELVLKELGRQLGQRINKEFLEQVENDQVYDETLNQMFTERFAFQYPYKSQRNLPVKVTVSELKKNFSPDQDGEELFFEPDIIPLIPKFVEEQQEVSGADRGTAYHRVMECLDFMEADTLEQIEGQLLEMERQKKIDEQVRGLVLAKDVLHFMNCELGKRMKEAARLGLLYKEQPFMMSIPASEKDVCFSDEDRVLVQGIIDVFFYEGDDIVLADYKTDKVFPGQEKVLVEKYGRQLYYYGEALERTTGKRVKEKIIYSFTSGLEIQA